LKTTEIKLKKISQSPNELKYLSMKLNKISKDLSNSQVILFRQKQNTNGLQNRNLFIYPMTTSGIAIIAIIILITHNNSKNETKK